MSADDSRVSAVGSWGGRALRLLVAFLLVLGLGAAAWADPPGVITVARYREFLAEMEDRYDERAARAVAVFFAEGAMTQEYLLSECLRSQTVKELREWIRDQAPAELTLQQALRLNARGRGCQARDLADTDLELATKSWRRP